MGVDCNACHHGYVNFRTGQLLQRLRQAFPTTALYSQIILSKEGGVKSHVVLSLGYAHDLHHVNNRATPAVWLEHYKRPTVSQLAW